VTRLLALLLIILALVRPAAAHELRPAYLELAEAAPGHFNVLWKVPAAGDRRLGLYLRLPASCNNITQPASAIENNAYFERWQVSCDGGLKGQTITIDGLRSTLTDVLARITWADGSVEVERLTPEQPSLTPKGAQTVWEVARTYFMLGVEHILGGIDHLLFVLALMLLIRDPWMLVKTVTAFTLAHSVTLTGAALGYLSLPQAPVEAVIALSIAFVARELILMKPGERRLSEAYPWIVAFSFGLLHGFGFAGALKEIGLPHGDVPLALFTFNLGVEAGQLVFVAAMLILYRAAMTMTQLPLPPLRTTMAYGIGAAATFWLLTRLGAFIV
jgi:hydrogenase/urease accessory protein HupE